MLEEPLNPFIQVSIFFSVIALIYIIWVYYLECTFFSIPVGQRVVLPRAYETDEPTNAYATEVYVQEG